MRTKFLSTLLFLGCFLIFSISTLAQTSPDKFKQPNVDISLKSYWCSEVENLIFSKEPKQGEKLTVGVRVKFTKKRIIIGTPQQKLCGCAFEGPSNAPTAFWSKTMSLRLIGIKYSETETNLLEYYGPTPSFTPYDYSGFPVIGFTVTESDLKRGYLDVWGWVSKEALQCREAAIYASFAIYNKLPYSIENECHPKEDFKKVFKPGCLDMSTIDKEKIQKDWEKAYVFKLPDLEIAKLNSVFRISKRENEHAVVYDELDLMLSVKNSGFADVPKFKILIEKKWEGSNQYIPLGQLAWSYDGKNGTSQNGIIEILNLKAGEKKDIAIFIDNSQAPKVDCWLRIKIDPANEIAEIDEDNNIISEILFPSHYVHPEKYKKKKF